MTTTDNQDCFDCFFKERERKKMAEGLRRVRQLVWGETACAG